MTMRGGAGRGGITRGHGVAMLAGLGVVGVAAVVVAYKRLRASGGGERVVSDDDWVAAPSGEKPSKEEDDGAADEATAEDVLRVDDEGGDDDDEDDDAAGSGGGGTSSGRMSLMDAVKGLRSTNVEDLKRYTETVYMYTADARLQTAMQRFDVINELANLLDTTHIVDVKYAASGALANFATQSAFLPVVVSSHAVEIAAVHLQCSPLREDVSQMMLMLMKNVAFAGVGACAVLDTGILPRVVELGGSGSHDVAKEALGVINNLALQSECAPQVMQHMVDLCEALVRSPPPGPGDDVIYSAVSLIARKCTDAEACAILVRDGMVSRLCAILIDCLDRHHARKVTGAKDIVTVSAAALRSLCDRVPSARTQVQEAHHAMVEIAKHYKAPSP